jgi:hypothetical protein
VGFYQQLGIKGYLKIAKYYDLLFDNHLFSFYKVLNWLLRRSSETVLDVEARLFLFTLLPWSLLKLLAKQ